MILPWPLSIVAISCLTLILLCGHCVFDCFGVLVFGIGLAAYDLVSPLSDCFQLCPNHNTVNLLMCALWKDALFYVDYLDSDRVRVSNTALVSLCEIEPKALQSTLNSPMPGIG